MATTTRNPWFTGLLWMAFGALLGMSVATDNGPAAALVAGAVLLIVAIGAVVWQVHRHARRRVAAQR